MTPPPSPIAGEFKLSDAVSCLNSQTAGVFQLWAFYTATVLGCLVLTLSHRLTPISAPVLLIAFWTFAMGELKLLRRNMTFIREMREAIGRRLESIDAVEAGPFYPALWAIAHHRNPVGIYVVVQVVGNLCVTALMIANGAGWVAAG